jgi:hypothetical protein
VQKNYVLQVLLVTLGFSLVVGLIAVIDAPQDWSQPLTSAASPSGTPTSSGQTASQTSPSHVMSPRVVDFADKADSPSDNTTDDPSSILWQECHRAGFNHDKACEDAHSHKTGKIDHC